MYRDAEKKLNSWYAVARRKPLVIRGARQVGKTTLVRRFCAAEGITLFEINLEKNRSLDTVFATLDLDTIIRELQVVAGRRITAALRPFVIVTHLFLPSCDPRFTNPR